MALQCFAPKQSILVESFITTDVGQVILINVFREPQFRQFAQE